MTHPTAQHRVLILPELLTETLLHLDHITLLLSQRVSKHWHYIITTTPSIQAKLFFRHPARFTTTCTTTHSATRVINPFLITLFGKILMKNMFGAYNIIWTHFLENTWIKDAENKVQAFTRKDASWRKMMPCYPCPTQIYRKHESCERARRYIGDGHCDFGRDLVGGGGVRLGTLWDLMHVGFTYRSMYVTWTILDEVDDDVEFENGDGEQSIHPIVEGASEQDVTHTVLLTLMGSSDDTLEMNPDSSWRMMKSEGSRDLDWEYSFDKYEITCSGTLDVYRMDEDEGES